MVQHWRTRPHYRCPTVDPSCTHLVEKPIEELHDAAHYPNSESLTYLEDRSKVRSSSFKFQSHVLSIAEIEILLTVIVNIMAAARAPQWAAPVQSSCL
jgi:hypothetical protein